MDSTNDTTYGNISNDYRYICYKDLKIIIHKPTDMFKADKICKAYNKNLHDWINSE